MSGGKLHAGRASDDWVAASRISLSAGWGTAPVLAVQAGSNDSRGQIQVTAKATPGAGPTVTVTFDTSVGFDEVPVVVACRADAVANAVGEVHVTAQSATGFTLTFDGTPVADEVYKFNYMVVG